MATTRWLLWSDESGERGMPLPIESPPSEPPQGGEIHLSADGCWLTVYAPKEVDGETRLLPTRVYVAADGAAVRAATLAEHTPPPSERTSGS